MCGESADVERVPMWREYRYREIADVWRNCRCRESADVERLPM